MRKLFSIVLILSLFMGCSPLKKMSDSELSLKGTSWVYTDEDWSYTLTFEKGGKLKSNHPNDNTPNNDNWKQTRTQIHFEFNDGFSQYDGEMKSLNRIEGSATNGMDDWKWKMKRVK